jgi:hypothetical protein
VKRVKKFPKWQADAMGEQEGVCPLFFRYGAELVEEKRDRAETNRYGNGTSGETAENKGDRKERVYGTQLAVRGKRRLLEARADWPPRHREHREEGSGGTESVGGRSDGEEFRYGTDGHGREGGHPPVFVSRGNKGLTGGIVA